MSGLFALAVLMTVMLPSAAHAIDCARASSHVEHIVCGDPRLVRADSALNRAYAAILKAAPDPEIRAMLVTSQKRWIAVREDAFGDLDRATNGQTGEGYPKAMQRSLVLHATLDRTASLAEMSKGNPKQLSLIKAALEQRRFNARFTGGPFAGFNTSCFFYPGHQDGSGDHYGYSCVGTAEYQNHDRICSQTDEWATYSVYTSRAVADIVAGDVKRIASCKEEGCVNDGTPGQGWSVQPDAADDGTILTPPLPKLDTEIDDDQNGAEVAPWLKACLTDKEFPTERSHKRARQAGRLPRGRDGSSPAEDAR